MESLLASRLLRVPVCLITLVATLFAVPFPAPFPARGAPSELPGDLEELREDLERIAGRDDAGDYLVSDERLAEIEARVAHRIGLPPDWRVRLRDEEWAGNSRSSESALGRDGDSIRGRIRHAEPFEFEVTFLLSLTTSRLCIGHLWFVDESDESAKVRELRRTRVYYPRRALTATLTALAAELEPLGETGFPGVSVNPITGDPEARPPFARVEVSLSMPTEATGSITLFAAFPLPESARPHVPPDAAEDRRPPGDLVIGPLTTVSSLARGLADAEEILAQLEFPFDHHLLLRQSPTREREGWFRLWLDARSVDRRVHYPAVIPRRPAGTPTKPAPRFRVWDREYDLPLAAWGKIIAGAHRLGEEGDELLVALAIAEPDPASPDRPRAFVVSVPRPEDENSWMWTAKTGTLRHVTVDAAGSFAVVERWELDRIRGWLLASKPKWRAMTADDREVLILLPPRQYDATSERDPARFQFGTESGIVFGGRVFGEPRHRW